MAQNMVRERHHISGTLPLSQSRIALFIAIVLSCLAFMGLSDTGGNNGPPQRPTRQERYPHIRQSPHDSRSSLLDPLRSHAPKELSAQAGDMARLLWSADYASGLAASTDEAYDITVDDSGNVYVTGTGTFTSRDGATTAETAWASQS